MLLQAKILGVYYYWLFLFDANWERDRVLKAVYLSLVNFEFMLLALPLLTDNEFLFIPKCRVWNGRSMHGLSPESSLRDEPLSDMELIISKTEMVYWKHHTKSYPPSGDVICKQPSHIEE